LQQAETVGDKGLRFHAMGAEMRLQFLPIAKRAEDISEVLVGDCGQCEWGGKVQAEGVQ
jgi:hypothetical protein